jgi:hypothetical protein
VIELVDIALGAAGIGVVSAVAVARKIRSLKDRRDERAQLIAMGEGMGIEYVPGEDIEGRWGYRARVIERRDEIAKRNAAKRERDEKGRFV